MEKNLKHISVEARFGKILRGWDAYEGYRYFHPDSELTEQEYYDYVLKTPFEHGEGKHSAIQINPVNPNKAGLYAFASGAGNVASGNTSHVEGFLNVALGHNAHAEGAENVAEGSCAHAEGIRGKAVGNNSHAEGDGGIASGEASHVEGIGNKASGRGAHAEGSNSEALGNLSHAEGDHAQASGLASHAEGFNSRSLGPYSHAEGFITQSGSTSSHAEGYQSKAIGESSHAEGIETEASGRASHAEGYLNKATGNLSHAEGGEVEASAKCAHAEGLKSVASHEAAHAEGIETEASGHASHAEGQATRATAYWSHAEGRSTDAMGNASHAEGGGTNSSGPYSHAEGYLTNANGKASHSEGENTSANGKMSHAQGYNTCSNGSYSHAGGQGAIAEGEASFSHGINTVAKNKGEFVVGKNNTPDETGRSIFQVGAGTPSAKKTVLQADDDGTIHYLDLTGSNAILQHNSFAFRKKSTYTTILKELGKSVSVNDIYFCTSPTDSPYYRKFIFLGKNSSEEDWSIIEPQSGSVYKNKTDSLLYGWYDSDLKLIPPANAVRYDKEQTLTEEQKQQARGNIGLENVDNTSDADKPISNATREALEGKPDTDGRYPKMTVGFAENLVGDGSPSEEVISFRPTAGENRNVKNDGAARIEKIKGNSLVWNQYADISTATKGSSYVSVTKTKGEATVTIVAVNEGLDNPWKAGLNINNTPKTAAGEKYFCEAEFMLQKPSAGSMAIEYGGSTWTLFPEKLNVNVWERRTRIFTTGDSTQKYGVIRPPWDYSYSQGAKLGDYYKVRNIRLINLTKIFGAGNEPDTVEEFYARMPKGVDINAYNAGEIVDGNYKAVATTGFNQFNGTYAKVIAGCSYYLGGSYTALGFSTEEGGATEEISIPTSTESIGTTPSDRLYTPTRNGYIYATGENICINLSWNTEYGYLNGTYAPYKPYERDLSWVVKYFRNGMRSAGSARDEIRFNYTTQKWEAVQVVGVRAYSEGDDDEPTVKTDGKNTNYPLTTPIVTEIEEEGINMDYDTSDYGTEELLSDVPTAPLVADIVYEPNALSSIKNIPEILEEISDLESNKQETLSLTVKDNGNIVIGNLAGQTKEFMPATPSGHPMHDAFEMVGGVWTPYSLLPTELQNDRSLANGGYWSYRENEGGLNDITTEEFLAAYTFDPIISCRMPETFQWATMERNKARFNITNGIGTTTVSLASAFRDFSGKPTLEVVFLSGDKFCTSNNISGAFRCQTKLKKICCPNFSFTGTNASLAFEQCSSLEEVYLKSLNISIDFRDSPNLKLECILFMINNSNTTAQNVIITLHSETYAKAITDEDIIAALEEHTNITLASA
uniref:hypothetical protein n=1 Tax=Alistipes sp. TaxID=1872444 RepID=UPI004055C6CC